MSAGVATPIERERAVVSALLALQLLLWLGFAVHRAPRFPGSLSGTLLGIAGAVLMVLPSLAYVAVKRIPGLKRRVIAVIPMRRLLAWHVWGGIVGSVLAILHSGHRYDSVLGIALTTVMLLVVFSGYVGRHFMSKVSLELREKQALLEQLVAGYNGLAREIAVRHEQMATVVRDLRPWSRLRRGLRVDRWASDPETYAVAERATALAESIADLEYTISAHERLKQRFRTWLVLHIVTSIAFYALLALHVWASLYFGLRWLA